MKSYKTVEFLYGEYLYFHNHHIQLQDIMPTEKECWDKILEDAEILDLIKDKAQNNRFFKVIVIFECILSF